MFDTKTLGAIKSYPRIKLRKFNKVAIVTGSSRGIGAQIAITLAEAGASVVINYSSNQTLYGYTLCGLLSLNKDLTDS
jgi:NAD(P)-dependent dehydrogenase (short-subunit alcohol dehydrogenase family)